MVADAVHGYSIRDGHNGAFTEISVHAGTPPVASLSGVDTLVAENLHDPVGHPLVDVGGLRLGREVHRLGGLLVAHEGCVVLQPVGAAVLGDG